MTQTTNNISIVLPSEITLENAVPCSTALKAELHALCQNGFAAKVVLLDAKEVVSFDSAALSVILQLRRDASTLGKEIKVVHMPSQLLELAKLYGIDTLLA